MEIHRPRLSSRDLRESLVSTLRNLCAKERSVTHVCNETGINRQQFAKYLDGRSMPSFENAMRIADYFDITCEELFGFRTVSHVAGFEFPSLEPENSIVRRAKDAIEKIEKSSQEGDIPSLGYYHFYINAASNTVKFKHSYIKSIMRIERAGSEIVTDRRQYLQKGLGFSQRKTQYLGVGHIVSAMVTIRYCDPVENSHLSSIILRPQHIHGQNLTGIVVGRCNTHGGEVGASPVFLEYLGVKPNLKTAIAECGMFAHGAGRLSDEVEAVLKTQIRDDQYSIIAG